MRPVAAPVACLLLLTAEALSQSSWERITIGTLSPGSVINSITTSGNLALASVSGDPIYKAVRSTNGGATWETPPLTDLAPLKLKAFSSTFLYGVRGDSIMTSPDGGISAWMVLRPALNMILADLHYINSSPGQAWAVGDSPYVAITTNNWGNSPPPQIVRFLPPMDSVSMNSVQFFDNNFGFVTGRSTRTGSNAGIILRTTDGGQTWQNRSLPDICPGSLTSIVADFVSPLIGWAVQTCGTTANFYKTTDGGSTWSPQTATSLFLVSAFDAVDSLRAWAAGLLGANGGIAKTSNGGINWSFETVPQLPQPPGWLLSIAMRDTSRGFACGQSATLLVYAPAVPTDVSDERGNRPRSFELSQNYPNPFNGETRILFTLQKSQPVALTVYNILGQPIRTLIEGVRPAGKNEVGWDGRDGRGLSVPSGIYFYKLTTREEKQVRKMVLLK